MAKSSQAKNGEFIPRKIQLAMQAALDEHREWPDQTPVAVPEQYLRPLTLEERLQQFVQQRLSIAADEEGYGTDEEENDFEEEDDGLEVLSSYQIQVMNEEFEASEPEAPVEAEAPSTPAETKADSEEPPNTTPQGPGDSGR